MNELRDALERTCRVLTRYASAYSDEGDPVLSELLIDLQEVLRTAETPSEMQQLVEWLEAKRVRMRSVAADDERLGMEVSLHDVSIAMAETDFVLKHIRTKFLGEEK